MFGKQFKALLGVAAFEAKGLFDFMLMHYDVANAVHQAILVAAKAHPQLVGSVMGHLIYPMYVQDPQDILVPYTGRLISETVLDQTDGFRHNVI
jgi:hypothetical protein